MTPIERLRAQARDARADYGAETARGGEPVYPAWVDDVAAVCDELERLRALGGGQAAPQKAEPSDEPSLAHELDGVIADVEQGNGFDAVCLETIKRVRALLARYGEPVAGEDIMINVEDDDVYTLPLEPSGLTSGPRFVVHVPAAQPEASGNAGEMDERAAFEAWYSNEYFSTERLKKDAIARDSAGDYVDIDAHYSWAAWKKRATLAAQASGQRTSGGDPCDHEFIPTRGPVVAGICHKCGELASARAPLPPKRRPYNASGSLSEYGVFPECDAAPVAAQALTAVGDSELLDALRNASWGLVPFEMPTGGGDADIGWRVVSYHTGAPHERTEGRAFHDEPRDAIRAAMQRTSGGDHE